MKRVIFFLLFLVCICYQLPAQDKITVLTVNGDVRYFDGRNNIGERVLPGKLLPPRGAIRADKEGMAMLLFKGQRKKLEGGQEMELGDLLKTKPKGNRGGYFGRFWGFVGSAVNNTEDNSKLENYHQRYMGNAKGGVKGWGKGVADIEVFGYHSGPLGGEKMDFHWQLKEPQEGHIKYTLEIYEEASNALFFKAYPRSNALSLDIDQYNFKEGAVYSWRVKTIDLEDETLKSEKILFSYEPGELATFLAEERLQRALTNLEEGERELLLLYALEEEGFYHSTYAKYGQLVAAAPENTLYKRLFASFLIRMGDLDGAKAMLGSID